MKRILLITGKAIVTLIIATQVLAQDRAEVPNIAELRNLIEEGLLRVYGQHYVYREDEDWQVSIDSLVDSHWYYSFVKADNEQRGRVAADGLAAAIKAKYGKAEGEVVLINSIPNIFSLDQRANGFKEQISEKYPNLTLVANEVADGHAKTVSNIMTDLIATNPTIRGVFAPNLIVAQHAGRAIAEYNLADQIKLISFDPDDNVVDVAGYGDRTLPSKTYATKREKKGDTASGVVIARKNAIISIDITPCSQMKEIVTFVMPYKEKQISDANCEKVNYPQSQVIQQ
jgi:hypothetical protein